MTSATKGHCISGSPPEKVTPPPERAYTSASLRSRAASASAVHCVPTILRKPPRQTGTHSPQATQPSGWRHTRRHAPQWTYAARLTISSRFGERPSGLWHQRQRSGQPFMNTVVRMPGPSYTANSLTSKTTPVIASAPRGE